MKMSNKKTHITLSFVKGHNIITRIEALFSGIANKPKEFDKTFSEYKAEFKVFNDRSAYHSFHQLYGQRA